LQWADKDREYERVGCYRRDKQFSDEDLIRCIEASRTFCKITHPDLSTYEVAIVAIRGEGPPPPRTEEGFPVSSFEFWEHIGDDKLHLKYLEKGIGDEQNDGSGLGIRESAVIKDN
jgi:hypothetical protein